MNRGILSHPCSAALAVLALLPSAPAQNLLTNNAGFEANTAYYTPGWGYPDGSPDALPGWLITLDPNGDGFAGAANNQSPQDLEGTHFGYIFSGTGSAGFLETAAGSRAPVEEGTTYTLWFLTRGDASWSEANATVSLIWYANDNNDTTKGAPATLELTLPAISSAEDPVRTFHITAVAPQGAHYAAARVTRPADNYAPVIVDDFVIMAEPAQVPLAIKKNEQADATLFWPRSLSHQLEECDDLTVPNGWHKANKPVKGIGATNYVAYPLTPAPRFFRLATD
jgi:hypothetical protein